MIMNSNVFKQQQLRISRDNSGAIKKLLLSNKIITWEIMFSFVYMNAVCCLVDTWAPSFESREASVVVTNPWDDQPIYTAVAPDR